ncbi:MAG TPA: CpaF family protein [Candidatus Binataceae bacterium]|jgi:pilus assembly protein CpaF|nr:CpaF family protein [Candidatus Binataceae bacterium]
MGLIDRLHGQAERPPTAVQPSLMGEQRPAAAGVGVNPELFQDLKRRVQERLLRNIDVTKLEEAGYAPLLSEITAVINSLIEEDHLLITEADRARLVEVTTNDMLGLGPLEPLLQDNEISDILVNGYNQVWIERRGKLYKTAVRFQDDAHLMSVINRIVSRIGRRIDEASPMVDARLPDGSRVHAIIPPLAIDGPGLCIRRFGGHAYRMGDLITNGTLTRDMAEFMRLAILTRLNILVSGGTGSGKTTLLNCLSSYLPENQRIITIEDAAELALQQPHVFRLETRPPNVEGKGEVTQRELFRNTLRMRPDRVIVGEVRGAEVLDMLQAMSTGHDGSMATIHANNPRDSLGRLEMMMLLSGVALPEKAMRQYIAAALNVIIHIARFSDGSRKVIKITEITGMEGETVLTQDLFEYVRAGVDPAGTVLGSFRASGTRSIYAERMETAGFPPPPEMFVARTMT